MTVEVFWGGGRGEEVFAVTVCVRIIAMVVCGGGGEFGYWWGGGVGVGVGVALVLIFRRVVLSCTVCGSSKRNGLVSLNRRRCCEGGLFCTSWRGAQRSLPRD